ncbi:MAG: peptidyl-prolyl cis-trans isomerase [Verrucomicrobiales bacterium]|nr:peptidyl-prolyl cis-trans isomerase [Verrucomicrobiales bacterium]
MTRNLHHSSTSTRVLLASICVASVLLLGSGCNSRETSAVAEADIVARIDGRTVITVRDVEQELARRPRPAGRAATAADRQAALDDLVRHQILLGRAIAAGYEQQPEVRRQIEQLLIARYEADKGPDLDRLPTPTPKEIEEVYHERASEFSAPARVRAALIRVAGSAKATPERQVALREKAERMRDDAVKGGAQRFSELAIQHSDDRVSRHSGGDVGWIDRSARGLPWPAEVTRAMFSLEEPGAVSPVIYAEGDAYLVRLTDRESATLRPLSEVGPQISHRLLRERRDAAETAFQESQRTGLSIDLRMAALERVALPAATSLAAAQTPPPLPAR